MLQALRNRMRDREDGFTLIELMVVVLIIAILVAIAIPTFLGARERAQDKAAQSSARNGLTAAKTIFTDNEDYADATVTELSAVEPSLTFVASGTASSGQNEVSVNDNDADSNGTSEQFYAAVQSDSGTCFFIQDDVTGPGTQFASSTNTCSGTQATSESYSDSW